MQSAFALAERPTAEVLARIRQGIPPTMFDQVAAALGLPTATLAQKLGIARRTIVRKQGAGAPLSTEASEKVLRVARICNLARSLFASNKSISQWLSKPDGALGNIAPIDMLDTDLGARAVEDLLRSLAHGQFV
jgi:putative toxin-antitoxin system antitoxin component (TIGR02293 family)